MLSYWRFLLLPLFTISGTLFLALTCTLTRVKVWALERMGGWKSFPWKASVRLLKWVCGFQSLLTNTEASGATCTVARFASDNLIYCAVPGGDIELWVWAWHHWLTLLGLTSGSNQSFSSFTSVSGKPRGIYFGNYMGLGGPSWSSAILRFWR